MWRIKAKIKQYFLENKHYFFNKKVGAILLSIIVLIIFIINAPWEKWLSKLDPHPIQFIALDGNPKFTQQDDIQKVIAKTGGLQGFFAQDVTSVKEQVEQLSWIKTVIVRKQWPDRLRILVSDYEPMARWNDSAFLSKTGVVFTLPADKIPAKKFPHLFGTNEQSRLLLKTWIEISNYLKQQGLVLTKLKLDERGAWQVILNNGLILKLGRNEWKEKLDRFMIIYPNIEVPENKK